MAYDNIKKLKPDQIDSGFYFLDANIWIYSLQGIEFSEQWKNQYATFFYNLIESDIVPKPKIIVPTLLISEIINTYLQKIAIPEYKEINGINKDVRFDFKKDYRYTLHCKENLEKICDDIKSFSSCIHFVPDSFIVNDISSILSTPSTKLDFNDYIYYLLCKDFSKTTPVTFVTNDGDFAIEDLPVLTLLPDLFKLKFSTCRPLKS